MCWEQLQALCFCAASPWNLFQCWQMAKFRINEIKYLCHCIQQLKKLASHPQPEKNVPATWLFPSGRFARGGEERLGLLSGISGQRATFPEQSLAASCLLPGSVDKWPLYLRLAVAARGEHASGLLIPGLLIPGLGAIQLQWGTA